MVPTPPPTPVPPTGSDRRGNSFSIVMSFVLGAVSAFFSMKLYDVRATRPMDVAFGDHYRMNVNQATPQQLAQLPRVGAALAERIVSARPIESNHDLDRIAGLGPKSMAKLQHSLTVPDGDTTTYSAKPLTPAVININEATLDQLQTLPSIGPKLAQRIIDERSKQPFQSIADLRRVPGIGPKTLEKLRPWVVIR